MSEKNSKNLSDLPESSDLEFWGEGQRFRHKAMPIKICNGHNGKKWMELTGYIDNYDGTVSCKWCPWGTQIPGYLKCMEGRIIDLRSITR